MMAEAIGAPMNAARTRKMMKTPPPIAILSFLRRIQTCSQYPRALTASISPSSVPDSVAIAP